MHDLLKIAEECISELKAISIPIQDNKIDEIIEADLYEDGTDAHCYLKENNRYRIEVWREVLKDNVDIRIAKKLISHELIHTCENCMNHRGKFRQYARRADKHYGYGILHGDDDYLHPEKPVLNKLECPKCKSTYSIRNADTSRSINSLKKTSRSLLPRCPFCRTTMIELVHTSCIIADNQKYHFHPSD